MRPALEAPTYLGSAQRPLTATWDVDDHALDRDADGDDDDDDDGGELPTRRLVRTPARPRVRSAAVDDVPSLVRPRAARALDDAAGRGGRPNSARGRERAVDAPSTRGRERTVDAPSTRGRERTIDGASVATPLPPPPAPPATAAPETPPIVAARGSAPAAGIGAIDPLQVVVPPELGAPIYAWVRRLALQADLAGADRVLRDALTELTSSLAVAIVYPGADGLWSLAGDDEIPADATPLVAVAEARRAVIASHTALVPIVTTTETVAVVVLTRNPRNPGYHPIEQIAMVALARESAAILHHLAVQHLQRASERQADQGSLYRGEALEAHRTRGTEGAPVQLSPGWVQRTYPLLVATILIALGASIFITVPTYSAGSAVVVLQGTPITAPAVGTVEEVLVKPGQSVKQGTILVRLHAAEQEAELTSARTDADNATIQYLFDQQDEQIKKTLAAALVRVEREQARLESRVVRARKDGTVSDVRVQVGQLLQPGDHILQIVAPGAEPEMWAFLPGKDRPRLRASQLLQVELVGYTKTREQARIYHVAPEVIGGNEAAKMVGAQLADSLKLQGGSWVFVRAKLPARSFRTEHRTYFFHHGMPAKAEVKIQAKPFLVTLLPALEKYLP